MTRVVANSKTGRSIRSSKSGRRSSILRDETPLMRQRQRREEQRGHRRLARVLAQEHPLQQTGTEQDHTSGMRQHPFLDNPRFDGIADTLNPNPMSSVEAKIAYENAKREQQLEHQMKLGLQPKMSSKPKPGFL